MNCSLYWSFISCGELHCDAVKIKTQLVFLKTMRVFGLERLFGCFVIVGYSFPEERSRASNQGVFLIFTVFSGGVFSSLSPPPPRSLWLAPFPPLFGEFQHGAFASKLRAQRKRLHCRLGEIWCWSLLGLKGLTPSANTNHNWLTKLNDKSG